MAIRNRIVIEDVSRVLLEETNIVAEYFTMEAGPIQKIIVSGPFTVEKSKITTILTIRGRIELQVYFRTITGEIWTMLPVSVYYNPGVLRIYHDKQYNQVYEKS